MITFIVYSSILLSFVNTFQFDDTSLCAGNNATSEYVIDYCHSQDGSLIHRCCRSSDNETFIAVDLMHLDLIKIPDFKHFDNFNYSVIDLRNNNQLQSSPDDDFLALTSLDVLILPEQVDCPGGHRVWEVINKTSDHNGNLCEHQKDFCVNSTGICDEQRSYCSTNGPNHFSCLCKTDYYGYKCLRQGTFPTGIFFGLTIGLTILSSILLYWTQRRHIKK